MMKQGRNDSGFSMVELMIVLVIMGGFALVGASQLAGIKDFTSNIGKKLSTYEVFSSSFGEFNDALKRSVLTKANIINCPNTLNTFDDIDGSGKVNTSISLENNGQFSLPYELESTIVSVKNSVGNQINMMSTNRLQKGDWILLTLVDEIMIGGLFKVEDIDEMKVKISSLSSFANCTSTSSSLSLTDLITARNERGALAPNVLSLYYLGYIELKRNDNKLEMSLWRHGNERKIKILDNLTSFSIKEVVDVDFFKDEDNFVRVMGAKSNIEISIDYRMKSNNHFIEKKFRDKIGYILNKGRRTNYDVTSFASAPSFITKAGTYSIGTAYISKCDEDDEPTLYGVVKVDLNQEVGDVVTVGISFKAGGSDCNPAFKCHCFFKKDIQTKLVGGGATEYCVEESSLKNIPKVTGNKFGRELSPYLNQVAIDTIYCKLPDSASKISGEEIYSAKVDYYDDQFGDRKVLILGRTP